MIKLKPMTAKTFEEFKKISQTEYGTNFSTVENVALELGIKNAVEQFAKLVPDGLKTKDQYFFEAFDATCEIQVGYLWLGIQERFGRKVVSINEISLKVPYRGKGFGKQLMNCIEDEARRVGAPRIRLHVFHHNEIARKLYSSMGFTVSSLEMFKLVR
ncbi:MAG: GNAT family N-acetyltransferase [Bdellovibrionaceae bacterium]|nr:GNAT family N-acetyltransferase [Bdellovibrio sp.]